MLAFGRYISSSIQEYITYRVSVFMELFNRIGIMLIQISIWNALFIFNSMDTSSGAISLSDMISYSFLTASIGILLTNQVTGQLNSAIRSGDLAFDLIRPISMEQKLFAQFVGIKLIQSVVQFLPTFIIYMMFFYNKSMTFYFIPYFIVSLVGATTLTFFISYIVGLVAIWWTDSWPLNMLMDSIMKLFSGMWIPLWFFPNWLSQIAFALPYSVIYYGPINILLGKTDIAGVYSILLTQLVWIIVLYITMRLLWLLGKYKLTIQGG